MLFTRTTWAIIDMLFQRLPEETLIEPIVQAEEEGLFIVAELALMAKMPCMEPMILPQVSICLSSHHCLKS